ncbi:MAG TPA: lamin tail domain-containing protein [Actinomycetota bacterium]
MKRSLLTFVAIAMIAAILPTGSASAAYRCPYVTSVWPGASPWSGDACSIGDGDTFVADVDGASGRRHVRITGLNTTERGKPKGTCHSEWATTRLTDLIQGKALTMRSAHPNHMVGDRYWRWVNVGTTDVATVLLREGLAIAEPHPLDVKRNHRYIRAAQLAARDRTTGRSLWNPAACAAGPKQAMPLRLWVQWNADGTDVYNPNGEFVRIRNDGSQAVSLKGWWLRDSSTSHTYFFPDRAKVRPHDEIVVKMGKGRNTRRRFYFREGVIFMDTRRDGNGGDGAYLFDPDGDLRAGMQYPCVVSCWDPAMGNLKMTVHPAGSGNDEWVRVKNVGPATLDMDEYVLETGYNTYTIWGHRVSSRLKPGEVLEIRFGLGGNTRLKRHWGKSGSLLGGSGVVKLRTWDDTRVACAAWGGSSC